VESTVLIQVEQIFQLQERCLQHALPVVTEEFMFIKKCMELILNHRVHKEVIDELDDDDRERIRAVNTYLNESLSHLMISLKLALYGANVESLSILRNAYERMTNMAAVVENQNIPHQLKYKTAVQKIKAQKEIQKRHYALSTISVHVKKSMSQRFTLDGKSHPAIGVAIDPDRTRLVMRELMNASLYVVRVLTSFYNYKREMVGEAYFQQVQSLEDTYKRLA
jgi:hypothetical protein